MKRLITITGLVILLGLLVVVPVLAQEPDYEIRRWTVDGGGGVSTKDDYKLTGIIGQPDAGVILSGGDFTIEGGFVPGISPSGDFRVSFYLPLVTNNHITAPDLVVQNLIATSDSVQVVVENQGSIAVKTTEEFWVDVYINPHTIPTGVNQRWENLSTEGLRWGVTAPALPLEAGETITLTLGDIYYWPSHSNFGGTLTPGTTIYAQVDAHNIVTDYGAVYESHERTGGAYNNITSVVYNGATAHIKAAAQTITGWLRLLTYGNFPPLE